MFREKLNQRGIGFAVVGLGAEINDELVLVSLEDFFLRGAGFYGDLIFHSYNYNINSKKLLTILCNRITIVV